MGFLTSYRWRGIELNDGLNYLVPMADTAFDDLNPASSSYAYRYENTPSYLGIEVREGVFTLNIEIVATTAQDFDTKLSALKQLFDTRDPALYDFERQLPWEQSYKRIQCHPTEFSVNRVRRRVSVTLDAPDKRWVASSESNDQADFWTQPTDDLDQTITVNYTGSSEVEPIIEITPLEASTASPSPQYYREVYVFLAARQQADNEPIRLVGNWDTGSLVSAGKMRSDGLDITVTKEPGYLQTHSGEVPYGLPNSGQVGTINRLVLGTQSSRDIWIKPDAWAHTDWIDVADGEGQDYWNIIPDELRLVTELNSGNTGQTFYVKSATNPTANMRFPERGFMMVENEMIEFSTSASGELSIARRGVNGNPVTTHPAGTVVRYGFRLFINYGYAAGYEKHFPNDFNGWPNLDYSQSHNTTWVQTELWGGAPPYNYGQVRSWQTNAPYLRLHNLHPGERSWPQAATASNRETDTLVFRGYYDPAKPADTGRWRAYLPMGDWKRELDYWRVTYTVNKAGAGIVFGVTQRNFGGGVGEHYTAQVVDQSGVVQSVTTSMMQTTPGTIELTRNEALWMQIYGSQPYDTTEEDLVTIDKVEYFVDGAYWRSVYTCYPDQAGAGSAPDDIGPEKGIVDGEFGVYYEILNTTYPEPQPLVVQFRGIANRKVTIDCFNRTVKGTTLEAVSYTNPVWLRLKPGNNVIRFRSKAGVGKTKFNVRWTEIS